MARTSGLMTVLSISISIISMVVVLMQLFSGGVCLVEAVASPPATAVDCITVFIDNLMDCLDYVTPGNYSTVPPATCCTGLANIVKTDPICLCQFLGNKSDIEGFPINGTKSFTLPAVCNVSTPSHSLCPKEGVLAPASTPTMSHTGHMAPSPSDSPHFPHAPDPLPMSDCVRLRSAVAVGAVLAGLVLFIIHINIY